ncbi:MAG: hypothetical protein RLO17_23775 [Cyclobacteriaceae bacterium]|jgi:hypothetical protein|tara:strand:- start:1852 stop:2127 length:276 start_codon:yes stop_codon:yes gene_type:complete
MTITVYPYQPHTIIRDKLNSAFYKLDYRQSIHFGEVIKRLLMDQFDDIDEIILSIYFNKNGGHKIDYSAIENRKLKSLVKSYVESLYPIHC